MGPSYDMMKVEFYLYGFFHCPYLIIRKTSNMLVEAFYKTLDQHPQNHQGHLKQGKLEEVVQPTAA